jgi:hypothetical protein
MHYLEDAYKQIFQTGIGSKDIELLSESGFSGF